MNTSPGLRYRESQDRVADIVSALGEDDLVRTIAGSPKWCGRDVLAHLTGAAEDYTTGNMAGAPSEAWTAAHIARAEGQSVEELIERWHGVGDAVQAALDSDQLGLHSLWDVLTHEGDLRETHGLGRLDGPAVDDALAPLCQTFGQRYGGASSIEVRTGDSTWIFGGGEPAMTLTIAPYELFRGMLGRRSRQQMTSWDWGGGDPEAHVPFISVFGVREDDQPIP